MDQMYFSPAQVDRLVDDAFAAIRQYNQDVRDRPAYPSTADLEILKSLASPLPASGSDAVEVLSTLVELGAHTAVPTTGGRFFGYVAGGVLPVALASRLVADAWDQASALHAMSPLAATLEKVSERWVVELLGLPDETFAGFSTGTSMATFCALAGARHHLLTNAGWDVKAKGVFGAPPLRIVANEAAHSCVWRSLRLLGVGEEQIVRAKTDSEGRILPADLPTLDDRTILILQAGDVNTGAFDNFEVLCPLAQKAGAWTHIDGAFGLWAAASPRYQHLTKGIELGDSWACDAHKTLNAPYECGLVLCRHAAYRAAMETGASYAPIGAQRDGMAYVPEMSRRARAVELWAILKSLGRSGVAALVDQLCARALLMATLLREAGFTVLNEVSFNQVLLRCNTDAETARVLAQVQQAGECWCGPSRWKGQAVIRFSVCSWATTEDDIQRAAKSFRTALSTSR